MSGRIRIILIQFFAFTVILNFTWIFWWITDSTPVKYPDEFIKRRIMSSILSFTQVYVGFQIVLRMFESKKNRVRYLTLLLGATLFILLVRGYFLNDIIPWREFNTTKCRHFIQNIYYHLIGFNLMGLIVFLPEFLTRYQKKKETLAQAISENTIKTNQSSFYSDFYIEVLKYLSAQEDKSNAEEIVLKLSELLRFIVYESETKTIYINKEIRYTNLLIDLQSSLYENIEIKGRLSNAVDNYKVAGMDIMKVFRYTTSYLKTRSEKVSLQVSSDYSQHSLKLTLRLSKYVDELNAYLNKKLGGQYVINVESDDPNCLMINCDLRLKE